MNWQRWLVVEVQNGFVIYEGHRDYSSNPNDFSKTFVALEISDVNKLLSKLWKEEISSREE